MNVRCEKKEIDKVIVPIINKVMKQKFELIKIKNNEVFGFFEIELKLSKKIDFNFGVSQRAKDSKVCGDSYLVYENDKKYIFAISDGMGVGLEARDKSKKALDLLKKFMDIGFEEKQAVKSINYILRNESNKESYATLDLFVYDKINNEFYFSKNGACNSCLVNKDGIKMIQGNDLPIGIIDKIEFKESKIDVENNDYIFMVSDGINEKKLAFLNKLKNKDPQKMAREVLEANKELSDDETVMVIKIKK